jgi:hypothetical protein
VPKERGRGHSTLEIAMEFRDTQWIKRARKTKKARLKTGKINGTGKGRMQINNVSCEKSFVEYLRGHFVWRCTWPSLSR